MSGCPDYRQLTAEIHLSALSSFAQVAYTPVAFI